MYHSKDETTFRTGRPGIEGRCKKDWTKTGKQSNVSTVQASITYNKISETLSSYDLNPGTYKRGFDFNLILANIKKNRPVIISGVESGSYIGHLWICDGWKCHDYGGGDIYNYHLIQTLRCNLI